MKTYAAELEAARMMDEKHAASFPFFTAAQNETIRRWARGDEQWVSSHRLLHNTINVVLMCALLAANTYVLLAVKNLVLVCFLHGYLMYSITNYSLHEGSGHNGLIRGRSRLARVFQLLLNNVCRLFFADPSFYKSRHIDHHARFGTQHDGAFTNYVLPHRFLLCLIPLAGVLPFNDYKIHAGPEMTKSRIMSEAMSIVHLGSFLVAMSFTHGFWFALFVLVIGGPWVAFVLDRLRETTEHNLMPTHHRNGARSFGPGFWGLLVGGGPWGQPCHLMHHLAPSLPWYMQLRMHFRVRALMTQEQRRAFLLRPVIGYPVLLVSLLRETFAQTPNFGR